VLKQAMRRAAVLGSPIGHSLSPVLHRAAYAAMGLNWTYDAVEVDSAGLADFLDALDPSWVGLSLTMPLKETVLPLLDETSAMVRLTSAANTVVLRQGRRIGSNTDVPGIVAAITEERQPPFDRACIIGAGATARSALAAASQLGVAQVQVVARRPHAADGVRQVCAELGVNCRVTGWDDAAAGPKDELVISTVPGDAAASLVPALPADPGLLLDVTYWPWPTQLAGAWQASGGRAVGGASMLLWQAAQQVELMTGRPAPVSAMRQALAEAIAARAVH
jgi:shikimate dehydrogenase